MVLYIDACVRENSRTRELAAELLKRLGKPVSELYLPKEDLPELNREALDRRTEACKNGDLSLPEFRYARQFAEADVIVIAAPYWDLSFPAILKKYIEAICITGISFKYSESGVPIGLCRAKKLYYVTTAGGPIFDVSFGYGYIEALAKGMFGIAETEMICAENLDIIGSDVEKIMQESKERIQSSLAQSASESFLTA